MTESEQNTQRKSIFKSRGKMLAICLIAAISVVVVMILHDEDASDSVSEIPAGSAASEKTAAHSNNNQSMEGPSTLKQSAATAQDEGNLRASITSLYQRNDIPNVPSPCRTQDPKVLSMLSKALESHTTYQALKQGTQGNETEALATLNANRKGLEAMQDAAERSAEYWVVRALTSGTQQGVATWLGKATNLCDSWAFTVSRQGRTFEAKQQLDRAADAYAKATKLAPQWLPPHRRRLLVAGKLADWPAALKALSALLTLAPDDSVTKAFVRRYGPQLRELGPSHPATQSIDALHPTWRTLGSVAPK